VHRAIINGDDETGVTIMRVVTELDAGPMFRAARRTIGPDETTPEVEAALAELGARLMVEVVGELAAGTAREIPQDDAEATYAPKIDKSEGSIAWTLAAQRIHDAVRGLQPWPLVSATVGGVRCLLHRTAVSDERSSAPAGTIVSTTDGTLSVVAGDQRILRVVDIQPEGKRVMSVRDFLAGRRIAPGSVITPAAR
jgi:methionyl-tRNA formyltransferase